LSRIAPISANGNGKLYLDSGIQLASPTPRKSLSREKQIVKEGYLKDSSVSVRAVVPIKFCSKKEGLEFVMENNTLSSYETIDDDYFK
jgi:hypothetical protein